MHDPTRASELLDEINNRMRRLAVDGTVRDEEFQDQVRALLMDETILGTQATRHLTTHSRPQGRNLSASDLRWAAASLMAERCARFKVDRSLIARGEPVCAIVGGYVAASMREAERIALGLDGETSHRTIPVGGPEMIERIAPTQMTFHHHDIAEEEADPALLRDLVEQVKRDIGLERRHHLVAQTFAGHYQLPDLLLPGDVDELNRVRALLRQRPGLAEASLEHMIAVCDGIGCPVESIDQGVCALWDATTRVERQRAAAVPPMVLRVWMLASVSPQPKADRRERHRLVVMLTRALGQGQRDLAEELADAYLSTFTVPVASKNRVLNADQVRAVREAARVSARRLPALAARTAGLPGAPLGSHRQDVLDAVAGMWASVRGGARLAPSPQH